MAAPPRLVLEAYGLAAASAVLITDNAKKPVWRVSAGGRRCYLKRMPMTPGRLLFVLAASRHLARGGVNLPPVLVNRQGAEFTEAAGQLYVLTGEVAGVEPNYDRHLDRIVRGLARFHLAGRGFAPGPECEVHSHLGGWPDHCQAKLADLAAWTDMARRRGDNPFARLFLTHVDEFQEQLQAALAALEGLEYRQWVDRVAAEGCVCHQDFAASNLRLGRDGRLFVYDLDSVTCDLPARDLRKLLNKVMKKGQWQWPLTQRILDRYGELNPLGLAERRVLAADLRVPHLFLGAAGKFFEHRAEDWTPAKLLERLRHAIRVERSKVAVVERLAAG